MGKRVLNFFAGPAGLPLPALERARDEILDFSGSGMSVMEISHRAKEYEAVHEEAIALVRELLAVPEGFKVLLLQGGASLQFAMVPLNFVHGGKTADYVVSGKWSQGAYKEANLAVGAAAKVAASTESEGFRRLPRVDEIRHTEGAAYAHVTSNNTVFGTQWRTFPGTAGVPLVADMSSDIMWRPIDVRPFGMIYAGAQKNLGPSGLVVAIVREDFLATARDDLPSMLRYKVHASKNSLHNTPPTFSIYILRNVLAHYKAMGGLAAMQVQNEEKGRLLYGCIDAHAGFYRGYVTEKADRSVMNATFHLPTPELDAAFVAETRKNGMVGLKGYRDVGGIRVSMYNAVRVEDVRTLVSFMEEFVRKHG
ncbi:MAG: 3-phosphoserine/phosphohydroxythreonine transaminase [Deltaproteobacteria bacterium]|nr:3-phosphoserine/phosphohydroxythreonine transaminase [Deltaproteobacteria bacterium]